MISDLWYGQKRTMVTVRQRYERNSMRLGRFFKISNKERPDGCTVGNKQENPYIKGIGGP